MQRWTLKETNDFMISWISLKNCGTCLEKNLSVVVPSDDGPKFAQAMKFVFDIKQGEKFPEAAIQG